jgi:GAF domain-containing protein
VHTPAYASLQGTAEDSILDLCEILDISERGALLQTPKGWELGSGLDLLLDFSETQTKVRTRGEVVWADAGGRVGIRFPELSEEARHKLQEWLFLNVMVAAANHAVGVVSPAALPPPAPPETLPVEAETPESIAVVPEPVAAAPVLADHVEAADDAILEVPSEEAEPEPIVRSDYTTTLSMLGAVQREIEGLGANYEAAMQLVADRVLSLTRASGAAVAADEAGQFICLGSAGAAPPVGVPLDRNAGISGRCVQTGLLQRCDDAERDTRVDQESCRELGIRSILAVPVRLGNRVYGVVEVFSPEAHAFGDFDAAVLQRLSETVQALTHRRARSAVVPAHPGTQAAKEETPSDRDEPLFATVDAERSDLEMGFLRRHLIVLVAIAVVILAALAYLLVPWISRQPAPKPAAPAATASSADQPERPETSLLPTIEEIRQRAQQGDPHAQVSLGTRYAMGEDEPQDYAVAARWFLKAAEQGMVLAQDTLGAYYWAGRGVQKDVVKAYYWSSVARQAGNSASEVRVQFLTPQLTKEQAAAIQHQAVEFFTQHPPIRSEGPR